MYDFPDDLRDAQLRLHRTSAAYRTLCRTLPRSVEPASGRTEQQKADEARLRGEVLALSVTVSTHPYWKTREAGTAVDARMALKHIHDQDPAPADTDRGEGPPRT
ncbi:hypothetical protein [Streptomyces camponoticapitis]|nr:hypothetical protein [Streptomyces camponoticapitis]